MFESPAKVAVPNSKNMSAAEQEALSKGEGRKLVVMFVLFVICSAFAVQLLLPQPTRPDNAPRGIPLSEEELMQVDKRFIAEVKIKPFVEDEHVEKAAQDFNQDQFEDDIFHHYIHKVHQSTDEELKAQYSGANVPYQDFNDLEKIQKNRGSVQRLHGRILSYWQRVLERWPNNSGLAWVWQAMVQTDDGIFMVVITDKDFEPEIGRLHGDSVEIDAVFIKGYQYSSKKGVLRMPLLAGRDFKRIRSATYDESYPLPLAYAMTIITLIMVFGGFLVHQYYKRADKSMGEHRASLRRKRMGRNSKVEAAKSTKESAKASTPESPAPTTETQTADTSPTELEATETTSTETESPTQTTADGPDEPASARVDSEQDAPSAASETPVSGQATPDASETAPAEETKVDSEEAKAEDAGSTDVEESPETTPENTEDSVKPDSTTPKA